MTRRYPKRKRAEVSYHVSSVDEDEVDEDSATAKVRQSIIAVFKG